jgi:hypothetical protein
MGKSMMDSTILPPVLEETKRDDEMPPVIRLPDGMYQ